MTPLRQRMIEEMQRRNLSPRTIEIYVSLVARFARHFRRSPDQLGPEQVRAYQLHLVHELRVSWSLFNQTVCALRFLYNVTLERAWPVQHIPYGKRPKKLPAVLSQDEVVRLLAAVRHPVRRLALTTAYAAGLRVSEVALLRVEDVDSARMVLLIRQAKGKKDRIVPLAQKLLADLRVYWRTHRPRTWLFPGQCHDGRLSRDVLQRDVRRAARAAGIDKHVTPHTLRHYPARPIIPRGLWRAVPMLGISGPGEHRTRDNQRASRKVRSASPGR